MRFRLYRPRHLRIEGIGESIVRKLREIIDNPRNRRAVAGGGLVTLGVVSSLVAPNAVFAEEPAAMDMTPQEGHEQTVDYDAMVSDDALTATVNEAVAESQAITDSRRSAPAQEVSTPTPAVSETVEEQAAPAQEVSTPTPAASETVEEQAAPVQEVTTPTVNEEIDSRVPQVETSESQEVTETSTSTETSTEDSSTETTDVENEEINDEKEAIVDNNIQQSGEGIVSDNPPVSSDQTETDINQNVSENTGTEVGNDETSEIQNEQENTNSGYQVISQDGNLIIVGDIPEDQLSQVTEDLINQYGEDAVNGLTIFDYDTISSQVDYGETVQLGNSGYTATKNEDGSIEIKDANGNVITNLQGQEKTDVEQSQISEEETSQDIEVPENFENKDVNVNHNEYVITSDGNGHYYFGLGGVALSNDQFQDLLSKLQQQGIVPSNVDYSLFALPSAPTSEMQEAGMTERFIKVSDNLYVGTKDGVTYTFYTSDANILSNILVYDSDKLEENYETSIDPNAQPGNKPGEDEPGNEIPGDKPGEDTPTPEPEPEPEPEPTPTPEPEPTPEPKPSVVTEKMPQTGDPSAIASAMAMAGLTAAGAGVASRKKRKKDGVGEDMDDDSFEPNYDDVEMTAQEWVNSDAGKRMQSQQANQYDYDELEAIAEQWKNSKEREEWLQQQKPKGRTR